MEDDAIVPLPSIGIGVLSLVGVLMVGGSPLFHQFKPTGNLQQPNNPTAFIFCAFSTIPPEKGQPIAPLFLFLYAWNKVPCSTQPLLRKICSMMISRLVFSDFSSSPRCQYGSFIWVYYYAILGAVDVTLGPFFVDDFQRGLVVYSAVHFPAIHSSTLIATGRLLQEWVVFLSPLVHVEHCRERQTEPIDH